MNTDEGTAAYIHDNLNTEFMGRELLYLEETTSTQDVARDLAASGAPEGTAVIARRQKAGKGRLSRAWLSPEGALAVSIVLRPSFEELRLLPAITSVAVFRTLKRLGVKASIKWPNDVLISGRKVCGILIENCLDRNRLLYSIPGIGINVNFNPAEYTEIADIATSLSIELGHTIPIGQVAVILFNELETLYLAISNPNYIFKEWVQNMDTIGRRIHVRSGEEISEGMAYSISSSGNLILQLDDGSLKEIIAGDVTTLKNSQRADL